MRIIKDFDSFINEAETATAAVSELDQLLSKPPADLQFFSEPKPANKPQVIGVQGAVKDPAGKAKNVFLKYKIEASYDKYFNFPVELANVTTAKQKGAAWGPGSITGFAKPYPDNAAAHTAIMALVPKKDKKDKNLDIKYAVCDADDDVKGKIKLSNGTYVYPAAEASWYNISDNVGDWMFFWVGEEDMKNALSTLKSKKGTSAVIGTPSGVKLTLTKI
jgi:hypothetical protein